VLLWVHLALQSITDPAENSKIRLEGKVTAKVVKPFREENDTGHERRHHLEMTAGRLEKKVTAVARRISESVMRGWVKKEQTRIRIDNDGVRIEEE
jgi:galactokinase/mevalonate kinase-like predicted kinase